jgi:hypothetical protein
MTSAFILLLYVFSVTGQGSGALTSAWFDTLALCQTAGEKAVTAFGDVDRHVKFVCADAGPKTDARH